MDDANYANIYDEQGNLVQRSRVEIIDDVADDVADAETMSGWQQGKQQVSEGLKMMKDDVVGRVTNKVDNFKAGVANTVDNIKTTASDIGGTATTALKGAGEGLKTMPSALKADAIPKAALTADAIHQVPTQTANAAMRVETPQVFVNKDFPEGLAAAADPGEVSTPTPTDTPVAETPSSGGGSSSGGSSGGGYSGGGSSSGGGYSGGGYTPSPSGNTTTTVSTPEIATPEVNTSTGAEEPVVETPTTEPETPTTDTPDTETPDTNPGMSGDVTTGEEVVPETPPADTSEGVADNITNIINGGTTSNPSGGTQNATGSFVGGFNSGSQSTPVGPDATLSPEDEILGITEEDTNGTIEDITGTKNPNKGSALDVISIDKDSETPNVDTSGGGSAIPAVLGVGVAGAAGVAGIHYIQKKNKTDDEYYEDESDETNNDSSSSYLSNYNAQNIDTISDDNASGGEPTQKYRAGSMNELSLDDGADVNFDDGNTIVAPQREELE